MSFLRRYRPLACRDFVELVTDYLDDALPDDERGRIDRHLRKCPGCTTALEQWRMVIEISGHLREDEVDQIDPATRDQLRSAFRRARSP